MSNPCLIVDVTLIDNWPKRHGVHVIPDIRQPRQLQPTREIAEAEALRLNKAHPGHHFVVFEARSMTRTVKVPTHVSITGQVLLEGNLPQLVAIDDADSLIPF
jgi:hypothetical protein